MSLECTAFEGSLAVEIRGPLGTHRKHQASFSVVSVARDVGSLLQLFLSHGRQLWSAVVAVMSTPVKIEMEELVEFDLLGPVRRGATVALPWSEVSATTVGLTSGLFRWAHLPQGAFRVPSAF